MLQATVWGMTMTEDGSDGNVDDDGHDNAEHEGDDDGKTNDDEDDSNASSNKISRRKLRAWLVTFDLKDMEYGVDFKIEEGRNTIGKASSTPSFVKLIPVSIRKPFRNSQ